MADNITKKLTIRIDGTSTSAQQAVDALNKALKGTSATLTSLSTETNALTNDIQHVVTVAANAQADLRKVVAAVAQNPALSNGIVGNLKANIKEDIVRETAARKAALDAMEAQLAQKEARARQVDARRNKERLDAEEALQKSFIEKYERRRAVEQANAAREISEIKRYAALRIAEKQAETDSIAQLEARASLATLALRKREAEQLSAIERKIAEDRLAGRNTNYAKGLVTATRSNTEKAIQQIQAPIVDRKSEIASFNSTLAQQEELLKASIARQTAIQEFGIKSVHAARARAAEQAIELEQKKNASIAAIQGRVATGQLSSNAALAQATVVHKNYAEAIKQTNEGIHIQERSTNGLILRVIQLTGAYKATIAVYSLVANFIRSIPEIGIGLESAKASLEATVGTVSGANSVLASLNQEAGRTGIAVKTLRESFSLLNASTSLSGESLETTWRIFTNLNTVITGLHLNADKANLIFLAISQIFNKTKVQSEELVKQLGNLLPGAFATFVKANALAGETQAEASLRIVKKMREGTQLAHESIERFTNAISQRFQVSFNAASQGMNAQIGRMQNSFTYLGEAIYSTSNGAMLTVVKRITSIADGLTKLVKGTSDYSKILEESFNVALALTAGYIVKVATQLPILTTGLSGVPALAAAAKASLTFLFTPANLTIGLAATLAYISAKLITINSDFDTARDRARKLVADNFDALNAKAANPEVASIQLQAEKSPAVLEARAITKSLEDAITERNRKFATLSLESIALKRDLFIKEQAEAAKELAAAKKAEKDILENEISLLKDAAAQAKANLNTGELPVDNSKKEAAELKAQRRAELTAQKEYLRNKDALVDTYLKELQQKATTEAAIEKDKLDELKFLRNANLISYRQYFEDSEAIINEGSNKQLSYINQQIEALKKDIGELQSDIPSEGIMIKTNFDPGKTFENLLQFEDTIQAMAKKYEVNPIVIKAIIQQESAGDPNATSSAGAKGLMQLLPSTFKDLNISGAITNVTANIEAGTKYFSQLLEKFKDSEDKLALAIAAYNSGPNRIAKTLEQYKANWDSKLLPETENYVSGVISKMAALGGDALDGVEKIAASSEIAQYSTEQILSKKAEIQKLEEQASRLQIDTIKQQREFEQEKFSLLRKYTDEQKSALDSAVEKLKELQQIKEIKVAQTPGAVPTSIVSAKVETGVIAKIRADYAKDSFAEIKSGFDTITPAAKAYSDEIQKIEDDMISLRSSNSAVFDGALGGINIVIGAFTNMGNSIRAANRSTRLLQQAFRDAAAEQKRLLNFDLDVIENSSKDPAEKLKAKAALEEKYMKESHQLKEDYAKASAKIEEESLQQSLSGIRQTVAGFAQMFEKKSSAAKAFHAIEKTIAVAQLAMKAKEAAADLAAIGGKIALAAANFFAQSGWAGFAGIAAMAAVMAGLGYNMSGGGASGVKTLPKLNDGTGSTLGDSTAESKSIQNSIEILKKNSDLTLPLTQSMLASLRKIETGIAGLGNLFARSGLIEGLSVKPKGLGTTTALATAGQGFDGVIGSLVKSVDGFLFGSTKKSLEDYGITALRQTVTKILTQGFEGSQFTDIKIKKTGFLGGIFGGNSTRYTTELKALDREANDQITKIFASMANAVRDASSALGQSGKDLNTRIGSFVIDIGKISLKGLKGDEIQKRLEAAFGKVGDDLAKFTFTGLEAFQRIGEGYLETLVRVASGTEAANVALEQLGLRTVHYSKILEKQGDVETEIVRQAILNKEKFNTGLALIVKAFDGAGSDLVDMYKELIAIRRTLKNANIAGNVNTGLIQGAGGLDNLREQLNTYYEEFFSDAERAQNAIANLTEDFRKLGLQAPLTQAAFRAMVTAASRDTTAAGQKYLGRLLSLAGQTNDAINARQAVLDKNIDNAMSALQRALNAQADSQQDMVDSNSKLYDAQREAANTLLSSLQQVKSKLESALDSTKVDNPKTQLAERNAALEYVKTAAQSGQSVTEFKGLDKALDILAKPSQNLYASFSDYVIAQAKATAFISKLNDKAGQEITTAEATLKAIEDQSERASQAASAASNQRNQMINQFQQQIDALRGVDSSVLSVEDAIAALQKAITAAEANKAAGEKQVAVTKAKQALDSAKRALTAKQTAKTAAANKVNQAKAVKATTPAQVAAKNAQVAAATKAFQAASTAVNNALTLVNNLQKAYTAATKAPVNTPAPSQPATTAAKTATTPATSAKPATTTTAATKAGTSVVVNVPAAKAPTGPQPVSLASDKTFKDLVDEVKALKKALDGQTPILNRIVTASNATSSILDKASGGGPLLVSMTNKTISAQIVNTAAMPVKVLSSVAHPVTISGTPTVQISSSSTNRVWVRQIAG